MNAFPAVPVTSVAGRRRGPRRLALVATAIVVVSLLRPWGDGGTPARTAVEPDAGPATVGEHAADAAQGDGRAAGPGEAGEAGQAGQAATIPAPSLAADDIVCAPADWRLVSLDHLGSWTVRSWTPVVAVLAAGPLDPAIRPVTLDSTGVLAIGACSPGVFDATGRQVSGGPARIVRAWRIEHGRATLVTLEARRDETAPGVATLYRPGATAVTDPWPAGEFVIEVAAPGAADGYGSGGPPEARLNIDGGAAPTWFIGLAVGSG